MLTVLVCLFVSSPHCLYSHQCVHVDWFKAKYFSSNTATFPFRLVCHLSPLTEAIKGINFFLLSGKIPALCLGAEV